MGAVRHYKCNPELNTECGRRFCKYNKNAIEKMCNSTRKEEFALNLGQKAKVKEHTPGQKNSILIWRFEDRWVDSTKHIFVAHDKK